MKVKLTIGDWSQDGHNQYDVFEVMVGGIKN
jgi:hypothetical protein